MMKLRSYLKKAGKEESGFTLIELMVVVVILGILGSIVIPRIMGDVRGDAEAARDGANLKMLQTAVDRFAIDTGVSTADWDHNELVDNLTGGGTGWTKPTGWKGPYVDEVPGNYTTGADGKITK